MGIKMPKVKMPSTKDIGKAFNDAGKAITNTADTVVKGATDAANTVANDATKAYNTTKDFAESLARDTAKAVEHTTAVCTKNADEYAKQGFNVTSDAWKQGTSEVIRYTSEGVEYIDWAATEAYKWADANACYIGLNMALTTGCVLYFTPKPDPAEPGTVTSTTISSTYLGWLAVKGSNTAMAMTIGEIITKSFLLIPGVKGNVDEKMLNRVIVNAIATCNPAMLAVSLATPAGVGIFIGSVISPIVAQLVCEKTAPKGLTKAVS
jgi:hypothetical protein